MWRKTTLAVFAFVLSGVLNAARAADVPIRNSGFEEFGLSCAPSSSCTNSSVPGWAEVGNTATVKFPSSIFASIPDGVNLLQIGAGSSSVTQALATKLERNTTYTLTYLVGHAATANMAAYKVELLAGSAVIAGSSAPTPPVGTFEVGRVSVKSETTSDTLIGQTLSVRISTSTGGFTYFDKLSLDATPTIFYGSASQIASGGGWKTTITLVNLAKTTSSVRVDFIADSGSPLPLPLLVTAATQSPATASSITSTIAPGATLVIESESGDPAPRIGWALVSNSEPISGFAIFRYRSPDGKDSEGTTPINTALTANLALPFDNTSGFQTGMTLVNATSAPAVINAAIFDNNGAQLALEAVTVPPMGHLAFFLPDRFASTVAKRGIVQFQNTSGGAVDAVGLRFSPLQTFTSVPISR